MLRNVHWGTYMLGMKRLWVGDVTMLTWLSVARPGWSWGFRQVELIACIIRMLDRDQ